MTPRYKTEESAQAKSQTRQDLLAAAAEEFAQYGFQGANINRISQAAGFAKGTIYNYFESKRALMQALIEDTALMHMEYIRTRVLQTKDAARRLEVFFEAGFLFVNAELARGKAIVNNLYGPDAGFKAHMYQAYLPMFEFVGAEILALGVREGIFKKKDLATTSNLVMLVYLGVASQVDESGSPWVDAGQISELMLDGLRIKPE